MNKKETILLRHKRLRYDKMYIRIEKNELSSFQTMNEMGYSYTVLLQNQTLQAHWVNLHPFRTDIELHPRKHWLQHIELENWA